MPGLVLCLVAFLLFSLPLATCAHTWHITPAGSGDAPATQAGIDSAASGFTPFVAAGTYAENVHFRGKALVMRGEAGATATLIDGSQGTRTSRPPTVIRLMDLTRISHMTLDRVAGWFPALGGDLGILDEANA